MAALQPAVEPPPPPPVQWQAPVGCPDLARVRSRVDALLGRPLADDELQLEGTIIATSRGWTLTLRTTVGTLVDERTLDANDCSVLADAAALVAVVMLDPVEAASSIETEAEAAAAAEATPTEPPPAPPPTPVVVAPEPEATPDPEPEPARSRPRRTTRPTWSARVRGGGEFGAVPGGTGAFDLGVALDGLGANALVRLELTGAFSVPRDVVTPNARTAVLLGSAAPRVCAMVPAGPVDIPVCGGLELGAMRASSNVQSASPVAALWLAAHVEPGVRWAFSDRVALWVSGQVLLPLVFPEFELTDPADDSQAELVYRPQPVGVRGLAGFEIRLAGPG